MKPDEREALDMAKGAKRQGVRAAQSASIRRPAMRRLAGRRYIGRGPTAGGGAMGRRPTLIEAVTDEWADFTEGTCWRGLDIAKTISIVIRSIRLPIGKKFQIRGESVTILVPTEPQCRVEWRALPKVAGRTADRRDREYRKDRNRMDTLHQYQHLREALIREFQEELDRLRPLLSSGINSLGTDHATLRTQDVTRLVAIKGMRHRFASDVGAAVHSLVEAYAHELSREAARLGLPINAIHAVEPASADNAQSPSEAGQPGRAASKLVTAVADALKPIMTAQEAGEPQRRRLRFESEAHLASPAQARPALTRSDDDDLLVAPLAKALKN
jgi:hypothetical protein